MSEDTAHWKDLAFDKEKPFYPLALSYLVFCAGCKELVLTGAVNFVPDRQGLANEYPSIPETVLRKAPKLKKLAVPTRLGSRFDGQAIEVGRSELAKEVFVNQGEILPQMLRYAAAVLAVAHDITKHLSDKSPTWEFFRHCRHAAAHNGRLRFTRDEPKRKAKWRGIELHKSMAGAALFSAGPKAVGGEVKGLLWPADLLWLLWDIEQAYL